MWPAPQRSSADMWLDRYRAVLCDLDGCLISGSTLLPGALDLAACVGSRLWIISNNSTDTPLTLSGRLARLGLQIAPDRILLAGATAVARLAADQPAARICIYGSNAIRRLARTAGLRIEEDRPDIVLLTRDEHFDYADLNRVIRQLDYGAALVVANRDATHPGADGRPVAETGALLAALLACRPHTPYREFGKPSPVMYRIVLEQLDIDPASIVAIGDNPATDGEGARRMGIDCAIVDPPSVSRGRDLPALLAGARDPLLVPL